MLDSAQVAPRKQSPVFVAVRVHVLVKRNVGVSCARVGTPYGAGAATGGLCGTRVGWPSATKQRRRGWHWQQSTEYIWYGTVPYLRYREHGTIVAPELTSGAAVEARVSSSSAHFELSLAAGSGSCRANLE